MTIQSSFFKRGTWNTAFSPQAMKRRASLIVAIVLCCLHSVSSSRNEILCGQYDTFNSTLGNITGNTMSTRFLKLALLIIRIVSADVWNPDGTGGQCLSVRKSLIHSFSLSALRALTSSRWVPMVLHSTPHGTGQLGQTPSIPTPTSHSTQAPSLYRFRMYPASLSEAPGICSQPLLAARIRRWEVLT